MGEDHNPSLNFETRAHINKYAHIIYNLKSSLSKTDNQYHNECEQPYILRCLLAYVLATTCQRNKSPVFTSIDQAICSFLECNTPKVVKILPRRPNNSITNSSVVNGPLPSKRKKVGLKPSTLSTSNYSDIHQSMGLT